MVRGGVEVDDLADGVHAGIGAAAGVGANSLARQLGNGGFERFLDGAEVELRLPAEEVCAVVAKGELDIPHGRYFTTKTQRTQRKAAFLCVLCAFVVISCA